MRLKKILALIMVGALMIGVVGCKSGGDNTSKDEPSNEEGDIKVEELVELLTHDTKEDYSYTMTMELDVEYVENYEGTYEAYIEVKTQNDIDKGISYSEQNAKTTVELIGYDKKINETKGKSYTVDQNNGEKKKIKWDVENEKWMSEIVKDEDNLDKEVLKQNVTMSDKGRNYILTVNCTSNDLGLDIAPLLLGNDTDKTVECDVEIVVKIDKESMKIVNGIINYDIDGINEALSDQIIRCRGFEIIIDDYIYEDVTLTLPEGF